MNRSNNGEINNDIINEIKELDKLYKELNPSGHLLQEIGETIGMVRAFVFVRKRKGIKCNKFSWFWSLDFFDGKRWLTILFPCITEPNEENEELEHSIIVISEAPLEDIYGVLKSLIVIFKRYINKKDSTNY